MRLRRKPRFPKRSKQSRKWFLLLIFIIFSSLFVYAYYRFDRTIIPLALSLAEVDAKTTINNAIYTEIQNIIQERGVQAGDFYVQDGGSAVTVNTVLVNDLCNSVAARVSESLSMLDPEPVSVPLGMAFGLDTLAYFGPRVSFNLSPVGNAVVDYDSRFESVGINQVHFEVWLTVESTIRIINPARSTTVSVTRDVSLVDTMISGAVPDTYLNVDGLTEGMLSGE